MTRQIVLDNEITLWWEYNIANILSYVVYLNDKEYKTISSTHITINDLLSEADYSIKIVADDGQVIFDGVIRTKKKKNKIDVTKPPYLAVGDGQVLNTNALQKALDDCTKEDYVYIPNGVYMTGALNMHSDTELFLEKGCVIQGSDKLEDYLPKIKSRFEGLEFMCYRSLINVGDLDSFGEANCQNIVIRGEGRVVGGGNTLRKNVIDFENARLKKQIEELGDKLKEYETTDTIAGRFRGRLINISNTENVVISGIGIESSPAWNLHMVYSKNLSVYNCKIVSHDISNGDGVDPDSVENCAIFGCEFDTSDDCIAIKSGRNPEGNVVNRKSSNIYIFDCLANGHGVSIGSEMSGGVENVYIWDCDLLNAYWGVQLKFSAKRGGFIKNVHVNKCKLAYFAAWSVGYNNDGEAAPTIPEVSDLFVEDSLIYRDKNIYEDTLRCVYIRGIDEKHPVKNVYFNNISIKKDNRIEGTIVIENAEKIIFNKVTYVE